MSDELSDDIRKAMQIVAEYNETAPDKVRRIYRHRMWIEDSVLFMVDENGNEWRHPIQIPWRDAVGLDKTGVIWNDMEPLIDLAFGPTPKNCKTEELAEWMEWVDTHPITLRLTPKQAIEIGSSVEAKLHRKDRNVDRDSPDCPYLEKYGLSWMLYGIYIEVSDDDSGD
jgi:hypothetical protein